MNANYVELAKRIGLGQSERIARLFAMVADLNEAELLLTLPANALAVAEKLGRSQEEVASMLQTLFVKGLVFPSGKTEPLTYRMSRDLVQFHDATILWPDAPRELLDLWQDFREIEWPEVAKKTSKLLPRPLGRVIPLGVTIQAKTHVLAFEDIKEIVAKARSISVSKCPCRLTARKCNKKLEACLQFNKAADYNIARGTGRKLSPEEALETVRHAEEEGLIHVVINKRSVDLSVCNCCPCCCQILPVLIKHSVRVIEPSRFASEVDPDLCSSCAACLDRCYFGAISLEEDGTAKVNRSKCMGCGLCQVTCPSEAISMVEIRESDFVPENLVL